MSPVFVGRGVGFFEVGVGFDVIVGDELGSSDGAFVGIGNDGLTLGSKDGVLEGTIEGFTEGLLLGSKEGNAVGPFV